LVPVKDCKGAEDGEEDASYEATPSVPAGCTEAQGDVLFELGGKLQLGDVCIIHLCDERLSIPVHVMYSAIASEMAMQYLSINLAHDL
jgi:hypothetical protein